ncbi:MAG TPA: SpoIID/LytB domain-containing protein [Candidatus Cybelea sp.]|nr:SpoIID/LytB domain-containing protein [Candidatus Cybelea sp.]
MLGAAAIALPRAARAQNDADPSRNSPRQALRVLLGRGAATPAPAGTFDFEGRLYRGTFEQTEDGQIVNVVDLEQYLYSVVPREMPPSWPLAALQAQAICARTYVLQRSDPRRSYDLVPSEIDQRYDGIAAEAPSGVAAVDASAGAVLGFGGGYAQIAYSSCCGGHTESSAEAWGNVPISYLGGVVCTSCADSPNFRWERTLGFDVIAQRFSAASPGPLRVDDLKITARDASGRARAFEVATDLGSTTVGGSAFRRGVGTRVLPSLLLNDLRRTPDGGGVAIAGGGLGHGVGLCQWGARGLAAGGADAAAILALYFPGTVLQHLG